MHNALWSITQQVLRQGLYGVFFIIVSRRITSAEMGLLGIATLTTAFLGLFLDLGFAQALVQKKEITPGHISSVFALNVASGLILTILGFLASWPLSHQTGMPDAQPIIAALSFVFLVTALSSVQTALAQREMKFKTLAYRDFFASVVSASVGIIAAICGWGVWSIVVQNIVHSTMSTIFLWRVAPLKLSIREVRMVHIAELWSFGGHIFLYSIFKYFTRNLDSWLVGLLFGPQNLGLYQFAMRFTFGPIRALQGGLGSFLFPKASRIQAEETKLRALYLKAYNLLNYLLIGYAIGLLTLGPILIPLVFGPQWRPCIPLIYFTTVILVVYPAAVPLGEMLKACNRPNWLVAWAIFSAATNCLGLYVGSWFGFEKAVLAYSMTCVLSAPVLAWLVHETIGLKLTDFVSRVKRGYGALSLLMLSMMTLGVLLREHQWALLAGGSVMLLGFYLLASLIDVDLKSLRNMAVKQLTLTLGRV